MNWHDVRSTYPDRWVLVEAIESHTRADYWYPDQVTVVDAFEDVFAALAAKKALHESSPDRDLFVAHTANEALEISVRRWAGVRLGS